MLDLKKKVGNKAKVEGSISEAYIIEEISNFCSHYFEPHIQTRRTKVPRNDDGGFVDAEGRLSVFTRPGRAFGKSWTRYLTDEEIHAVEIYVLLNCIEVEQYRE